MTSTGAIFLGMAAPTLLGTVLQKSWFGTIYNYLTVKSTGTQ